VPEKGFWLHFPSKKIPEKIDSSVDVATLTNEVKSLGNTLTEPEITRAKKCISYLTSGAPAFQKTVLGPCSVKNSKAALDFGQEVTDSIASWIKKRIRCRAV
jgi:3-deoxy-D-arabino-heptulosonate 7-phosphate (DAHP) synthase